MLVTSLFSITHFFSCSGTGYFGRRFGSFLVGLAKYQIAASPYFYFLCTLHRIQTLNIIQSGTISPLSWHICPTKQRANLYKTSTQTTGHMCIEIDTAQQEFWALNHTMFGSTKSGTPLFSFHNFSNCSSILIKKWHRCVRYKFFLPATTFLLTELQDMRHATRPCHFCPHNPVFQFIPTVFQSNLLFLLSFLLLSMFSLLITIYILASMCQSKLIFHYRYFSFLVPLAPILSLRAEQSAAGNQDHITDTRTVLWPPTENWNVHSQLLRVSAAVIIFITGLRET